MTNGLVGPSTKQGTQNGNRRPWRETPGIQIGGRCSGIRGLNLISKWT